MAGHPWRVVTRQHGGLTGSVVLMSMALCLTIGAGALLTRAIGGALPPMTVGYAMRWPTARHGFDLITHDLRTGWPINLTRTDYGDEMSWNAARGLTDIVVERIYPGGSEICLLGERCLPPISRYDQAPRLSPDGSRLLVMLAGGLLGGGVALVDRTDGAITRLSEPWGGLLWALYDADFRRSPLTVRLENSDFGRFELVTIDGDGVRTTVIATDREIVGVRWLR